MFEPIKLTWNGAEYTLPADQVLRTIADVEEILTLGELAVYQSRRKAIPMAKLSEAYARVLGHAGARVTGEEIYEAMFSGREMQSRALQAIAVLQMLMIPPESLRAAASAAGKPRAAGKRAASSQKSTSS